MTTPRPFPEGTFSFLDLPDRPRWSPDLEANVTPAQLMHRMGTMSLPLTPRINPVCDVQETSRPHNCEPEGSVPEVEWNFADDRWPPPEGDPLILHSGWFAPDNGGWPVPDNERHVAEPSRSHTSQVPRQPAPQSIASSSHVSATPTGRVSMRHPLAAETSVLHSTRLNGHLSSSVAAPDVQQKIYPVSLPAEMDMEFILRVTVNGQRGISLACPGLLSSKVLPSTIQRTVDSASYPMDRYFLDGTICTQRAYFACESVATPLAPSAMARGQFTLGHLLTVLARKQLRHWNYTASNGRLQLQTLMGHSLVATRGNVVRASSIYIVAIRRRSSRHGGWCYFPELEVRI
ncbi:hypothetical protein C2E23DRAFT_533027 [Lenzites betulinus]|nr:hypothetical protein C2E23DRAFT_533027 [Lenzites betulinus]